MGWVNNCNSLVKRFLKDQEMLEFTPKARFGVEMCICVFGAQKTSRDVFPDSGRRILRMRVQGSARGGEGSSVQGCTEH